MATNDRETLAAAACWRELANLDFHARRRVLAKLTADNEALNPIETDTIDLPAHWASYLVNGDASSFDYDNTPSDDAGDRDQAACDAVMAPLHAEGWSVVGCDGEAFYGRFQGLQTELLTYQLLRSR